MINCIIGILIDLLAPAGGVIALDNFDQYGRPPMYGGHFMSDITLKWEIKPSAPSSFIVIIGKRPCITPENITAIDPETNREVPFVIENATRKDGESVWRLKPANEFTYIRAVIDIDFVNRCTVA